MRKINATAQLRVKKMSKKFSDVNVVLTSNDVFIMEIEIIKINELFNILQKLHRKTQ